MSLRRISVSIMLFALVVLFQAVPALGANTYYVATTGKDTNPGTSAAPWRTIQKACNAAKPGSTVYILAGTYHEKVTVNVSGSAQAGFTTFTNRGKDKVIVDGTGQAGSNLFTIQDQSYIRLNGLEIVNDLKVSDGSGIRVLGGSDHISLTNNTIHHITGADAMAITVYGTSGTKSLSDLIIDGNLIYDCPPAHSETLTLNGNVERFQVTNNTVHDVNNIGIDFIGGEGTCPVKKLDAARNGVCQGNLVYNARSNYGGGYGAAIYVDGGHDILVTNNITRHSDLGIEVGAENAGVTTTNILVAENLVYENDKAGLVFGGYDTTTGRVEKCTFRNNTLYHNDLKNTGVGEIWVQYASNCLVENNLCAATAQNVVLYGDVGSAHNTVNYNLYFTPGGADNTSFTWGGTSYDSYSAYRSLTHLDANSLFADPKLAGASSLNFHLTAHSPAIKAGNPGTVPFVGERDIYGNLLRPTGVRIDIGAAEWK